MRVLFCSFTSPGYLYPLMGIALALRDRGHRVAFVCRGDAADTLAAAGLCLLPVGIDRVDGLNVRRWFNPSVVAKGLPCVEEAVAEYEPDVIITHPLCFPPVLARQKLDVPLAVVGFFAYPYPIPGLADTPSRRARLQTELAVLAAVRDRFGARTSLTTDTLLGDLYLLRSTERLEPFSARLPGQVRPIGALTWDFPLTDEERGRAWADLLGGQRDVDRPIIYIQNGTGFGPGTSWEPLLSALAPMDVLALASVGRMESDVGELPTNCIVRTHIPHALALPRAAAVVGGGHTALTLSALSHGIPGLYVPKGGETMDNVERVTQAGCGICLPTERVTERTISDKLYQLLHDTSLQSAASRIGSELSADDAVGSSISLIEALAAGRATPELPQVFDRAAIPMTG